MGLLLCNFRTVSHNNRELVKISGQNGTKIERPAPRHRPHTPRRGRPREFEPMRRSRGRWTSSGARATRPPRSTISARATGLNRPSLYGAFGDKRALYIKAYRRYREHLREKYGPLDATTAPLREKLKRILFAALGLYRAGEAGRARLLHRADARLRTPSPTRRSAPLSPRRSSTWTAASSACSPPRARAANCRTTDPKSLARVASAVLHTLSIRARARLPRGDVETIVEDAVTMNCRPAPTERRLKGLGVVWRRRPHHRRSSVAERAVNSPRGTTNGDAMLVATTENVAGYRPYQDTRPMLRRRGALARRRRQYHCRAALHRRRRNPRIHPAVGRDPQTSGRPAGQKRHRDGGKCRRHDAFRFFGNRPIS